MPLVVVTTAESKSKSADADEQAAQLLKIADGVFDAIGPHFVPDSWEIWENMPRAWLGGTLIGPRRRERIRPRSFEVPRSTSSAEPITVGLGSSRPAVHSHNCIVIRGVFSVGRGLETPATFEVNLARAYAKSAGDIVFETQRTAEVPYDGLFELLRASPERGEPFWSGLRDYFLHANSRIETGPTIRLATLKSTEGCEAPSTDFFFVYQKDDIRLSRYLKKRLLEVAVERGRSIYESMTMRSVPVYRDTVDKMIDGLSLWPAYDRAASILGADIRLVARRGGSVVISSRNPDAATTVANQILDALGESFWTELRRRLGSSEEWIKPLDALVAKRSDHPVALDEADPE